MTQGESSHLTQRRYRGRYAPSPSGAQHLGNLRTALVAWLHARLQGGEFLLRMEDIDTPRVVPGSADQILRDLEWMGLDWDGEVIWQSQRLDRYQEVFHELESKGRVFPCFCSRKQLRELSGSLQKGGEIAYPGTCRDLSEQQIESARRDKNPAYRLRVEPQGKLSCGDFVLKRADGLFAYQLVVVVDDLDQSITHVVRGADLFQSTERQQYLAACINPDGNRIEYRHIDLMCDDEGHKLSKRDGSCSLGEWRADTKGTPAQLLGQLLSSLEPTMPSALSASEALATVSLEQLESHFS